MGVFAKVVNGNVTQYPYLANEADIDNGIFPVVVDKPDTFRDEDEVWLNQTYTVENEFVIVTMRKRTKNAQEIAARDAERADVEARDLAQVDKMFNAVFGFIQNDKLSRDQMSELLTALRAAL